MKHFLTIFILYLVGSTSSFAQFFDDSNIPQTENLVKAGQKSITLLGTQLNVAEKAPNFTVVNENFTPVRLSDFSGHTILISVVPSLDTGVCSLQTKRFNKEVTSFSQDVVMLTISNDLPFAQKRFCKVENIDKIKVLSDSVWRDFGSKYGLLIKDMGLLTRAIFIIDKNGKIAYKELVANISNHPNYELALAALTKLAQPLPTIEQLADAQSKVKQAKTVEQKQK
jgi:thioredoxin-dependent peroxiredoxin